MNKTIDFDIEELLATTVCSYEDAIDLKYLGMYDDGVQYSTEYAKKHKEAERNERY